MIAKKNFDTNTVRQNVIGQYKNGNNRKDL